MRPEAAARDLGDPEGVLRLAALGRALADPTRVRILFLLAQGRACCADLERSVPARPGEDGVCVCEIQAVLGLRQSLVSYHLRLLKEAGLVREERRGRWSFYALDRAGLGGLADTLAALMAGTAPAGVAAAAAVSPGLAAGGKEGLGMAGCPEQGGDLRQGPQGSETGTASDACCCCEPPASDACCSGCC